MALFRLRLLPDEVRARAVLWVTASQRFELFLNGRRIARGPARSDPRRWHVQRVELPTMDRDQGEASVLAARVWHGGGWAGKAQLGGPAFLLVTAENEVDTAGGELRAALADVARWRCRVDASVTPHAERAGSARGHTAVGAGERFDAAAHPWGWAELGYDDAAWSVPRVVCKRAANPWGNLPLGHALTPEPIPAMEERAVAWQRFARIGDDGDVAWDDLPEALTIPAGETTRLVLDRGEVTNAYPMLRWSGGAGASIEMVTCEAAVDPATGGKGNRDTIAGKTLPGMVDVIDCDGGERRMWEPLWFRSFRYMQITLRAGDEPLTLHLPELTATGFPLSRRASPPLPEPGDRRWRALLDVSERTARLCSHETFFDCPHYEQAQFPGDGRILARYHYRVFDEDRLARNAIDDLHAGRTHTGLLRSHWPSRMEQVISTYSLAWIGMLSDVLHMRGDGDFLRPYLPAARAILAWFDRSRRSDGLIGRCEAPFVDWAEGFTAGNAPQGADGGSSLVTLMVAEAAGDMAGLEMGCGIQRLAGYWSDLAASLRGAVRETCWDSARGLVADTASRESFSVHGQVQAVLAGMLDGEEGRAAIARARAAADTVKPGTFYYRYHLARALLRCGDRAGAMALLDDWLALTVGTGLTTWPEADRPDPPGPRSDCHGWSVGGELILWELADAPLTPSPQER